MSISGINNYNYPNYYAGARHNMAKTGAKAGVLTVDDDGFAEKLLTGEDNAYDDE